MRRTNLKTLKFNTFFYYTLSAFLGLSLGGCQTIPAVESVSGKGKVLFLPQAEREIAFTEMEKYSDIAVIEAGRNIIPLKFGPEISLSNDLDVYFDKQHLTGLLVMSKGRVVLEKYAEGLDVETKWSSFSIAKSITSTLVGVAIKDGYIRSENDLVIEYIPELKGSVYEGVTIRHLLTMTSGVNWSERYTSPKSEVVRFSTQKAESGGSSVVSFMRNLDRKHPPGTHFNYNTGEASLIGLIVANATGKNLSEYFSEKIWKPYGMEGDAIWALDQDGREIGGCCISARLRDYARYGQFMLDGATVDGHSIVPTGWVETATTSQHTYAPGRGYGYMWWTHPNQSYVAKGIYGQEIAIVPTHEYMIVTISNWPTATGSDEIRANRLEMYKDIVDGIFNPSSLVAMYTDSE